MTNEYEVRDQLIKTMHSSESANARILDQLSSPDFIILLLTIAIDASDHGGDAPVAAGFYLTKIAPPILLQYRPTLVTFLDSRAADLSAFFIDEERSHLWCHVILALSRVQSKLVQPYLEKLQQADGWRDVPEVVEAGLNYR
jgi:hypothetical protein